jgi:hypothetical protein
MSKEATVTEPSHTSHHMSYEPPAYGSPSYTPPGNSLMRPDDERNWAVGAHLSGFVAAWMALGFLGPLVVLLVAGNRSAFVRRHAVEALNFNLSVLIYAVGSAVLSIVLIGIPMLIAVGLTYLVASIMAAAAAGRGELFRYPVTIRFVH